MQVPSVRVPKYMHHKSTGTARVRIAGREHSLGAYGTPASKARYQQLVAEWIAAGCPTASGPTGSDGAHSVADVVLAFWAQWAPQYPRQSQGRMRSALRAMRELYGLSPAREFGARALIAVRERMIARGWCRTEINARVRCIRSCWDWAVSHQYVDAAQAYTLSSVKGLRAGRSAARESEPVHAVAESIVHETLKHVTPTIAAMVRLQLLTGMRPGEVCRMTTGQIDASGPVWVYRPAKHKTAHHGKQRLVAIGPRAQDVLRPFLRPVLDEPVFSPKRAMEEHQAARAASRKTPPSCGNRPGTNRKRKPRRQPGDRYTSGAYRRAIERACEAHGIPAWRPNQLRHTRATQVRKSHGLDAAGALLGHAKLETTQIYAERDLALAVKVAAEMG